MEIGQKVKTNVYENFWFVGIYSDDYPDSESILIDNGRMTLIAPKSECVLADSTGERQSNIPVVIKSVCLKCGSPMKIAEHFGFEVCTNDKCF